MSTLILPQQNDHFMRAVWVSLSLHLFIFLAFTVKTVFFENEPTVYESAVRVDLVALPDKLSPQEKTQEQASPTPVQEKPVEKKKITEVKKEDAINLNKTKNKQSDALKKIREMEALEKIKKHVETEQRLKKASQLFKGNQLSSGSELSGVSKIQHDNYISNVKRHIYQSWALPEWLSKKDLKAQVLVRIDENGRVIYRQIYKSSLNPTYDDVCLEAIENASPTPPPPEKLVKIMKNEGILIGFPE